MSEKKGRTAMPKSLKLFTHQSTFDYQRYLKQSTIAPVLITDLGALFADDCLKILAMIKDQQIDTIFADPPFNLGKEYRKSTNDNLSEVEYLNWCNEWITECVRTLKVGGSIFIYNLPKWNIVLGNYLNGLGMQFRHWIAVEINATFPIKGRLYPSHYSLLYYTKGSPKTYHNIRTPIQLCRHCSGEIKDYGGYRKDMNLKGVNLKDVWTDIPPVRHWKYKSKGRNANALSTKLLERVIELSTDPGDLVLDPFGGSGITYAVCEYKNRNWLGVEIDYADDIIYRLESSEVEPHKNNDYIER